MRPRCSIVYVLCGVDVGLLNSENASMTRILSRENMEKEEMMGWHRMSVGLLKVTVYVRRER